MYFIRLLSAIVIAFAFGKVMQKVKMPAILGWLIAGMALGPYALNVLSLELTALPWYHVLLEIFEAFVGIMIGSELIIRNLKKSGKQILVIAAMEALMTFVVVSAAFAIVLHLLSLPLYLALVFGAIGLATAPAPSLSIVNEYKTKGPVTNTLLPIVALDDIIAISVFMFVMTFVVNNYSGQSLPLYLILVFTFLPLIIGGIYGYLFIRVVNMFKSTKNTLYIFIACLLLATTTGYFINHYLFDKSIVNFMLLGMAYAAVIFNMYDEDLSHALFDDFKPILGIGLIIVILNLGAPLDFRLIAGAGLFTFIYILSRAMGKIGGSYLGASMMKSEDTVRKYLGLTLLPHSGVSLVFTGMAASVLLTINPEGATMVQSTIAAAAVINEVFAVLLARKAFVWAKETN